MCTTVEFTDNPDEELWCIRQLRENNLFVADKDRPPRWNDEDCLCGVDVESVLNRSKLSYEYDTVWDKYYVDPHVKKK